MDRNNHDVSEEKLKELQRKEALSGSDEYDIQDNTYERAPITRQYVKDDVVVKSAEFVDDDNDDIIIVAQTPSEKKEPEDDIIIVTDPPVEEPAPVEESIDDKYTKKVDVPKFEKKPETLPAKIKLKEHDELGRDYIDRDNTIHSNGIAEFEKVQTEKKKKTANLSWIKTVLSIAAIIVSIIIAIFLFNFIKGYTANDQLLDETKAEYIEFVEATNKTLMVENNGCKDFKNVTEQFVIDAIDKDTYLGQLEVIKTDLLSEMTSYSLSSYDHVDVYDIKTLTVDYMKAVLNIIDEILVLKDQDTVAIKTVILSDVNDSLVGREQQFNNIMSLINDTSAKYDVQSELKENVIYFDIEK
jgi:hypothetical protein